MYSFHPSKGSTSQLTITAHSYQKGRQPFPSLKGFDLAADGLALPPRPRPRYSFHPSKGSTSQLTTLPTGSIGLWITSFHPSKGSTSQLTLEFDLGGKTSWQSFHPSKGSTSQLT